MVNRELGVPDIHQNEMRDAVIVGIGALVASVAHVGRMLYENKPIPARKFAGALILSAMVGANGSALVMAYWRPPAVVAVSVCIVLGFMGGPAVVLMASGFAKRYATKAGNALVNAAHEEGKGEGK